MIKVKLNFMYSIAYIMPVDLIHFDIIKYFNTMYFGITYYLSRREYCWYNFYSRFMEEL